MVELYSRLSNRHFFKAKSHDPYFLVFPLTITTGLGSLLRGLYLGEGKSGRWVTEE